ncbi:MAG TPA: hypothetical protein VLC52_06000 [Anaerolineae bacterium]|nr:hypothetical protein [Anaerolineae bacterium]
MSSEQLLVRASTGDCVEAGTRLMGLLGADIRHADLAFAFNNRLLSYWGRRFVYVPYSVPPEALERAIEGIRALDILACNVTFPHKVPIMRYLDEVDETTRRMGSVNLVVNREGVLRGYNTDSLGFMDALRATGLMDELDSALIYGAGGAGRALATALTAAGMRQIWMYDVIGVRSHEVESRLNTNGCRVCAVGREDLGDLRPALIVNATPLGRREQADRSPLDAAHTGTARAARLFFDLNYNPPRSRFLEQARALGVAAENGLRMMCYQAKHSIDIAAGSEVPWDWFHRALKEWEVQRHTVAAGGVTPFERADPGLVTE